MTIYELSRELILGTRLKRLGDRFLSDVSNIYKTMGILFEPSWFPIFFLLDRYTEMNVSDISNELDITKSGTSQMISLLEKKGLVKITCRERDRRTRFVSFDDSGFNLLKRIKPVWKLIQTEMTKMLDEGANSSHFLEAIGELERSFKKQGLNFRVLNGLEEDTCSISEYDKKYYYQVKELFFLWSFNYGIDDVGLLDNFHSMIQENAKYIFIALRNKDVTGAIITVLNDNKCNTFLCDRENINSKTDIKLVEYFLNEVEKLKPISLNIRFDEDKTNVADTLRRNGFKYYSKRKSGDSDKKFVIFKRALN